MAVDYSKGAQTNLQYAFAGPAQALNGKQTSLLAAGYNSSDSKAYYLPLVTRADGVVCVPTDGEFVFNTDNVTIGNIKVGSTDQTQPNSRWLKTDTNGVVAVSASTDIPTTLTGGSKTVAVSGTAETLGASLATKSIYIRAKLTNTSFVCIGDSAVDEATNQQILLYAGDSITMDIANRVTVYIDADVGTEGVDYLCMS